MTATIFFFLQKKSVSIKMLIYISGKKFGIFFLKLNEQRKKNGRDNAHVCIRT